MLEQRAKWASHARPSQQGTLVGSVAGFDGQRVAGACVTAVGAGRSVTTAAAPDGTFRLAGLTAGAYALEYRVCAGTGRSLTSSSGYLTTWSGGTSTQSTAARVQVAAGQVRHVAVVMLRPANPAATIAAGQASFRRELAANARGLSAAAQAKTGEISGKVTGKGKALRGICVIVVPAGSGQGYGATSGKNGTYAVHHVVAGRYHVIFAAIFCPGHANWLQQDYKDVNSPSALFNGGGTVVTVRAGHKVTGINANLRLGGEISGTVTSKSGAKLRGICVLAQGSIGGGDFFGFGSQTGAGGSYHLHALFPGKYSLQFSVGCGSGGSNYAQATHRPVKVGLGQKLTVNEKLAPGASITGTVTLTSSSGTPLSGICVSANNFSGSVNAFTATNSNGDYRVIGLTAGRFQLQFSPGCNNNGNYTSVTLTAHTTAGHQTSDVNAVLQVGAAISGTITGSGDKPLPGICIEVDTANSGSSFGGFDTNGTYTINQLSAGTYQVGFFGGCGNRGSYAPYWYQNQPSQSSATPILLTAGETFPLNVQMQPGATITGKVTSGGNGLSGVCVSAASQSDAELGAVSGLQTNTRHGTYTLANLAPGQYLINFGCGFGRYGEQWFPGAPDPATADLVSAPAGRTANINAALQPGGTIKGVVTGQAGHPLSGVCVFALNTKGTPPPLGGSAIVGVIASTGSAGVPAVTGSHGTYQISGLAAGRYQVVFIPCFNSVRYAGQSHRGNVTVRAGKTTPGIDGHLVIGGTISGHVTGTGGKPLRNICVVAASQSEGAVGVGITGKAGTYTIPALNSGRYTVEFSPCDSQNLVTVVAQARVTAPHATKGVNAAMHSGGSITGTVTAGSASGPAVSGACVEVFSGNSAAPVDTVFTGPDGGYLATGLPVGTYEVHFNDPQCLFGPSLAPQWYDGQLTRAAANSVSVTAVGSTTPSIDAALQPDGQITGTVSGKSAGPLSGACVTAVPLSAGSQLASGSLPIVAVTGTTGYTLAQLVPGRYKVKFSAGCGAVGYVTQWWKQQTSQKAATVIKVGPGQDRSGISATLSKSS
jgi:hypothetical protein